MFRTNSTDWGHLLRAVIAVVLVSLTIREFGYSQAQDSGGRGLFALGFLLLAGTAGGRLAALLKLPRLTGYLLAGLLCGPSVFGVLGPSEVTQLSLINGLALALIALQAGSEFTHQMLQKNFKSIVYGSFAHLFIIGLGMTLVFTLAAPYLDFTENLNLAAQVAVGAVFAVIAVSKSPAVVVAILGESKAKGPLSDHSLGIVVLLDVLVLAVFSLVLMVAGSMVGTGQEFSWAQLEHLAGELVASVAAGTTFGLVITFYFWAVGREKLLFLLVTAYGITAFCRFFSYDTLLVFVVAGYVVTNFSRQGSKMTHTIESISSVVMIVFFATAGASLHLDELRGLWAIVLGLFFVRALLTWLAAQAGHRLARDPEPVRKYGYTPFISQAGLSIGLAVIVSEQLPGVGTALATLAISVVALNELFGPVIFRWGLQRAGEVGRKQDSREG